MPSYINFTQSSTKVCSKTFSQWIVKVISILRCDIANQFDLILDALIFKVIANNQFIPMKNKAKMLS